MSSALGQHRPTASGHCACGGSLISSRSTPADRCRCGGITGFPGLALPHGLAAQKSFEGAASIHHGPSAQPFPEATALLDQLGLTSSEPPSDCTAAVGVSVWPSTRRALAGAGPKLAKASTRMSSRFPSSMSPDHNPPCPACGDGPARVVQREQPRRLSYLH